MHRRSRCSHWHLSPALRGPQTRPEGKCPCGAGLAPPQGTRWGGRARSLWGRARPGSSSGRAETHREPGSTSGPQRARPVARPFPPSSRAGRGGARLSPLPLASVPLAELSLPLLLAAVPARLRSGPLGHFLSALKSGVFYE